MQHSERECVAFVHMCVNMCLFVCVCVGWCGVCVYTFMCVSMYFWDREGSWVFASTALVVAWVAVYLTSCGDYQTGLSE